MQSCKQFLVDWLETFQPLFTIQRWRWITTDFWNNIWIVCGSSTMSGGWRLYLILDAKLGWEKLSLSRTDNPLIFFSQKGIPQEESFLQSYNWSNRRKSKKVEETGWCLFYASSEFHCWNIHLISRGNPLNQLTVISPLNWLAKLLLQISPTGYWEPPAAAAQE